MKPDAEPMMKHIINCLWAIIKYEDVYRPPKSEKSNMFHAAVGMIAKLGRSGFSSSVDLGTSTPSPTNPNEEFKLDHAELLRLRQQGVDMQPVYTNKVSDSYFWAPLYYSMIIDNSSEEMCSEVRRLYEEYQEPVVDLHRDNDVLCMESLLRSKTISDANKLYILNVLRVKVPWLFFVEDESGKYALHYAAEHKCSPEIVQFLLRANPDTISVQTRRGETPFHLLLAEGYKESQHFEQFSLLMLDASEQILDMENRTGWTALGLACFRHSPRAPKTVLALLQVYPEAAAKEDNQGNFPIHFFVGVKDEDKDGFTSNPAADLTAFQALLAANKEAVYAINSSSGDYLLHSVAYNCTLDMLKLVYEANPLAISLCQIHGMPLHLSIWSGSVEKIEYLYSLYPEAAHQVSSEDGHTLLHLAVGSTLKVVELAYSYHPGAIRQRSILGHLPLHYFVLDYKLLLKAELPDDAKLVLRFLLKHYPEAVGVSDDTSCTPYDMLPPNCNEVVKRLLLRAAPTVDISELHRLNYEARRGALYLLFSAELPESGMGVLKQSRLKASSEATMTKVRAGPRRSARTRKGADASQPAAAAIAEREQSLATSSSPQIAAPSFSSTKIWRLLKDRGDKVLLKEIVLYL